jgi:general secretion pathway protein G
MIMDRQRIQRGFTLIELLLVLVILASLAAIVVPKFANRTKQAKETQAITQMSNFDSALDQFELDLGRYPTTMEGLDALVTKPSGQDMEKWPQPYLKQGVPLDPWGNEYQYRYPGQKNEYGYDLYSIGPDGREGGDDDIDNWTNDRDKK